MIDVLAKVVNPDPKNNLGISGVERLRTPVAGILIVGLQQTKGELLIHA